LQPKSDNFVYWNNLACGRRALLTSLMSSQCCDCCSPSPEIDCKTEVSSPCPVLVNWGLIGIIMQIFVQNSQNITVLKQSMRACRQADLWVLFNMTSLTHSALSSLHTEHGHPWALLSFAVSS
jgi:hypothetical protein